MDDTLRLLTIHAHPDDESSKGAGTVARYSDEGVRCVLVCCTGGEAGDILNPAMNRPEVQADLAAVRHQELTDAAAVLGYAHVEWLGYRDSGMPDSEANQHPDSFARADLDEAVGRVVAILRRERPQVIITYPDEQSGYPHPDHLRVHEVTGPAVEAAADPGRYPGSGEPWQVSKIYYSMWSRGRILAMHEKMVEMGIPSPYEDRWFDRPSQDDRITTRLDVEKWYDRKKAALLAHATQIDPTSPFWFGLPDEVMAALWPWEEYHLVVSTVPVALPEDDLFAGVRSALVEHG
jgi:mycothiol S-conjugate amidase